MIIPALRFLVGAMFRHPIITTVGAGAVASAVTGKGAVPVAIDLAKKWGFGSSDNVVRDATRAVGDAIGPEGTGDKIYNGISNAGTKVNNMVHGNGDSQAVDGGQSAGGADQSAAVQQAQAAESVGILGQLTGGLRNLFGGVTDGIGGGVMDNVGSVGLLALAWLCFGRFGWLGKIGGSLMGLMALTSLFSDRSPQQAQGQQHQQSQGADSSRRTANGEHREAGDRSDSKDDAETRQKVSDKFEKLAKQQAEEDAYSVEARRF